MGSKNKKRTKKEKEGKVKRRQPSKIAPFFLFCRPFSVLFRLYTHKFLCRCLWIVKTKKVEKIKKRERFWQVSFFFVFTTHKHLHKNLWVVKTKKDEKRKRRERFWKVAFFLVFSFFVVTTHKHLHKNL